MSSSPKQGPTRAVVPARYLIAHSLETNMDLYSVLATYALMDPSRVPGPATLALVVVALALLALSVGRGRRRGT